MLRLGVCMLVIVCMCVYVDWWVWASKQAYKFKFIYNRSRCVLELFKCPCTFTMIVMYNAGSLRLHPFSRPNGIFQTRQQQNFGVKSLEQLMSMSLAVVVVVSPCLASRFIFGFFVLKLVRLGRARQYLPVEIYMCLDSHCENSIFAEFLFWTHRFFYLFKLTFTELPFVIIKVHMIIFLSLSGK